MTPMERQKLFAGLAQEINRKCADDGLFWAKFVSTRDESDTEQSIKPFPLQEEYVKTLWTDFNENKVCVVAKSRQMFVSWAICAYAVHWARYRPNQGVYFQTQNWPDAVAMVSRPEGYVEARMQFIENHLPDWMRQKAKFTEGTIQYPNGSIIQALSGGANQIRSKTPSLYIGDEFAFQEDQDKIWTSVAPLIRKGAHAVLISTPNGSNNQFAVLYHGHNVGEVTE